MNAITKSMQDISPALASFLARAGGSAAADILRREGLPQRRQEAWRYTSLNALSGTAFADAPVVDDARAAELLTLLAPEIGSHRAVFINGRFFPALSHLPANVIAEGAPVEPVSHPLATLNAALKQDGLRLQIPAGTDAGEIAIVSLSNGEAPFSTHLHHDIRLAQGARLVLRDFQAGFGPYLSNPVFDVAVAENAVLTHVKIQQESAEATHLALVSVDIGAHGTYDSFTLTLGAELARHEVHARLNGVHGAVHINGAQLLGEARHADLTSIITHAAPDCDSRQTIKNVVNDSAHAVFQGKIYVSRVAQKTDGYQMNQALLLSEKAQIDSKPELEIYADDVKCSHGATVGALDDDQMFFLRSRGIGLPQARAMLVHAFLMEAIDFVGDEALRGWLDARIDAWWARRVA